MSKPRLFWGPTPLINYSYLSRSLRNAGFESKTLVTHFYSVYKREDFDIYTDDIVSMYKLSDFIKIHFRDWILLDYALKNFDIFHISYEGLFLGETSYWYHEAEIIHGCNKKIIVMPYGSDAFVYSKFKNTSQQHAFLINYPEAAKKEEFISKRFLYWQKEADFCVGGGMIDGFGRWDSLSPNFLSIDLGTLETKSKYRMTDGKNDSVNIVHTPNHRGVKGTEFIIQAVKELQSENLNVNLILVENKKNEEVKRILRDEADILVEQLIMVGYGLSAIEGMATGLPVISNLENNNFYQLFSRYSFLSECPVVSSSPEKIKETLRILISDPGLRKELAECGKKYTTKYHSQEASTYLFNRIYDKVWYNKDLDIINLYHPLHDSSYNNLTEIIHPPLHQNQLMM